MWLEHNRLVELVDMCNSIFWMGDQVYITSDIAVKRKKMKKNGDSCMLCLEIFSSTQVFRT